MDILFQVNVTGLYSSESNQSVNFDRPVKSVAIDPGFASSNGKQFVTGDDKVNSLITPSLCMKHIRFFRYKLYLRGSSNKE